VLPRALWLRTLPPYRGGLRHCHVPHGFGPRLPAQEGSSAATCLMAPDHASLLRWASTLPHAPQLQTSPPYSRAPVLPCVKRLWTPPTYSGGLWILPPHSGGSNTVMCSATLRGPRALRIKKSLAATACSKARGFARHAHTLSRCLQGVRADDVIMTCIPCREVLQHHAIVRRCITDCS
jgi:hypothetical protein